MTWLRTSSIALVAMVLALPSPAHTAPVQARDLDAAYEHLLGQVAEGVDLRALPAVYAMDEFEDYLDADRLLVDRRRLAADRGLHPTVRAHVSHKLAIDLMHRGDHAGADAVVEGVGFLTRFSVAGPFARDASVLRDPLPPERGIRGDDNWTDGDHNVRWRSADRMDFAGYINVGALAHPIRGTTSYLTTTIHVPAATRATLWMGTSGAYRAWIGSRLVAEATASGPAQPDQIGWPVELAKGPNVLVLKVAAARQSASVGIYARLTDRRERPLAFHSTPLVAPVFDMASQARLRPQQSPAQVCARLAERDRLRGPAPLPRIEARYLAGYLLWRLHKADPARPWDVPFRKGGEALADWLDQLDAVAVAERRNELQTTPMGVGAEGFAPLLAVGSAQDTAQAQVYVDLASRATAGAPWARTSGLRVQLAGRGAGRIPPAWAELERLRQDAPDYWPAALLRAELDPAFGFNTTGLAHTTALAAALPNVPAAQRRYLRDLRGANAQVDEMRALEHWLGFRAADGASRARLAELLRAYRRPEEAATLLAQGRSLAPEAVGLTRLHADALADADLLVEASGVLEALSERRPRDASVLLALARLEDRRARPREATALLERALALKPFDEGLRARIAHRLGSAPTRELSWLLPAEHPSMQLPDCATTACNEPAWDAAGAVVLVHQRIVHRHDDGRLTVVGQRVMAPRTAAGAARAATLDIPYVPGRSIVEVLAARRVRKRGGAVSGFRREDRKPNGTTRGVYRQRSTARITIPFVEAGDTVEIAWRVKDVVPPSVAADLYADLHYLQGRHPRLWSRYVVLGAPRLRHAIATPPGATRPEVEARPDEDGIVVIARDAPAVRVEKHSAGRADISAYVHVSTTPSWDALGSWYWNLVKDQIIVDDKVRAAAATASRGARTPRDTVRGAYEWVARQTRYVGLAFGEHSYLPYRTTETLARGFGDCKDKATLLKAMLWVHEIPSHLVLVRTRQRGDLRDGVASLRAFDHVILWVPSLDLYLDATATWTGSGTLPPRLQGAPALLVRDGVSAQFTHLPRGVASANLLERRITADLRTGTFRADLRATGNYAAGYRAVVTANPAAVLQTRLGAEFGVSVTRATVGQAASLDAPFTARVTASGARWLVSTSPGRARLPVGPAPGLVATWAPEDSREGAVRIPFPFTLATRVEVRLPRGARANLAGVQAEESSDLGSYRVRVEQRGDVVIIDARYSLQQASIARSDYGRFRSFLARADAALGASLPIEGLP